MNNTSEKIGILGGSFNPIHIAHLIQAQTVKELLQLDKIIFLPSGTPPHKNKKQVIDATHRLKMLSLAIAHNNNFLIEDYEARIGGIHYTVDTMAYMKNCYPNAQLYFIVGADMVEDLPNWHRVDELLETVKLVGINRPGYTIKTRYDIETVNVINLEISSSLIRDKIKKRQAYRYLVPDDVYFYIQEENLYVE